jgi:23S rRNA (adenine2030-N6)-methyltransferase
MAAGAPPPELEALRAAVTAASGAAGRRIYPGSPWLIARALRARDRLVACELRPEEHGVLTHVLAGRANTEALCIDGFGAAVEACPRRGRALAVIDPPFERPDDYRRIIETCGQLVNRNPQVAVMVWTPLKDLETLDSFQRGLRLAIGDPLLCLEARMRPLDDPMRLNGCALSLIGAPAGMDASLRAIGGWVTQALGDGGEARIYLSL